MPLRGQNGSPQGGGEGCPPVTAVWAAAGEAPAAGLAAGHLRNSKRRRGGGAKEGRHGGVTCAWEFGGVLLEDLEILHRVRARVSQADRSACAAQGWGWLYPGVVPEGSGPRIDFQGSHRERGWREIRVKGAYPS